MKKLGWIGCGKMGSPMALNIIKKGYEMIVYDTVEACTRPLAEAGAKLASSPREVAEKADCFFTMLPNGKILESVVTEENGILAGISPGKILVDMSTIAPGESSRICKMIEGAGAEFLRAPVTGSTVLAASASLGVFASGKKEVFDKVLPVFEAISNNQQYLGTSEQSRVLKLAINLMLAGQLQLLAEAMVMIDKAGLDRAQAMSIIRTSAVGSPVLGYKTDNVVNHDYTPAFSVAMMEKDLDLALDYGKQDHIALPMCAMTRQYLAAISGQGNGNLDFSYLVENWEKFHGEA
ncbi:MAG: NAD(P)-dependent oxidoreductase [Lachnospiraceae bacterium]|nr:NAD(P)-dependent oxidoreductase [Lachnospiraceae bacterium]